MSNPIEDFIGKGIKEGLVTFYDEVKPNVLPDSSIPGSLPEPTEIELLRQENAVMELSMLVAGGGA